MGSDFHVDETCSLEVKLFYSHEKITSVFTLTPELSYPALEVNIQALVTADLITVLAVDRPHQRLMRMHTNRPAQYASGETWPLWPSRWQRQVFEEGMRLYCGNPEQVLQGFRDGADILGLGYQAAVAFPIIGPTEVGKRAVGAVNLLFGHRLADDAGASSPWCDRVAAQIDEFVAAWPAKG